jgi:hypothetical protein
MCRTGIGWGPWRGVTPAREAAVRVARHLAALTPGARRGQDTVTAAALVNRLRT